MRKFVWILWILSFLLLFPTRHPCLAGIRAFFHDEHKANAIASEFLNGLASHDYEKSYSLLLPALQSQVPYKSFVEMVKSQEVSLGKIESAVWNAYYPQPGHPLIGLYYSVRYSAFGEADYYLLLRLEGKSYLIDYFVNGPKGITPKMVLQLRKPIEPREVITTGGSTENSRGAA